MGRADPAKAPVMSQHIDPRTLRRIRFDLLAEDAALGRRTNRVHLPHAGTCTTVTAGNAAANRTTLSATLTGLNLQPNQYLVIRWNDADITGNDNVVGIDDLGVSATFTSTPEPASLSVLAVGAGLLVKRRRHAARRNSRPSFASWRAVLRDE